MKRILSMVTLISLAMVAAAHAADSLPRKDQTNKIEYGVMMTYFVEKVKDGFTVKTELLKSQRDGGKIKKEMILSEYFVPGAAPPAIIIENAKKVSEIKKVWLSGEKPVFSKFP